MIEKFAQALATVYGSRGYRLLTAILFLGFLTLYLFLLPGAYTGGYIGWISLRYLTGPLIFFSVALAALVSITLAFSIYGFQTVSSSRGQGASLLSLFASVIPGMLCCTPLVPTALALVGASTPTIFGLTGKIQGFFATYELHFLTGALLVLLYALYRSAGHLNAACPIGEGESSREGGSRLS